MRNQSIINKSFLTVLWVSLVLGPKVKNHAYIGQGRPSLVVIQQVIFYQREVQTNHQVSGGQSFSSRLPQLLYLNSELACMVIRLIDS